MADADLIAAWERWRRSGAPALDLLVAVLDAWIAADRAFAEATEAEGWRAAGASKWLCRRLYGEITAAEWSMPYRARCDLAAGAAARVDEELAFLVLAGEDHAGLRHHGAWTALLEVADAAQVAAIAAAWDRGGYTPAPRVERALVEAAVRTGRIGDALARLPSVRWPRDREAAVVAVAPHLEPHVRAHVVEDALAYVVAEDRLPPRYLVEPAAALIRLGGALPDDARRAWAEMLERIVASMSEEDQADCPDHRDVRLQLAELWCRLGDEPRGWTWVDRIRGGERWISMLELAAVASPAARELLAEEALAALGTTWAEGELYLTEVAVITRCGPSVAAGFLERLREAPVGATRTVARLMLAAQAPEDGAGAGAIAELTASLADHGQHEELLDDAPEVLAALDGLAGADVAGAGQARAEFIDLVLDSDDPFAWRDVTAVASFDELRQLVQLASDGLGARATDEREAIAALCATAVERIAVEQIDGGVDAVTAAMITELAHALGELDLALPDVLAGSEEQRRERALRVSVAHRGRKQDLPAERWARAGTGADAEDEDDELEVVDELEAVHVTVSVNGDVTVNVNVNGDGDGDGDRDGDRDGDGDGDGDGDRDRDGDGDQDGDGDGDGDQDGAGAGDQDGAGAGDQDGDRVGAGDGDASDAELEIDDADVDEVDDAEDAKRIRHAAFLAELEDAPRDGRTPAVVATIRERLDGADAMSLLRAEGVLASLAAAGAPIDDAHWSWLARALDQAGRTAAADRCAARVGFAQDRRALALELALARRDRTAIRDQLRAHCAADAQLDDPGHAAERAAAAGYFADVWAVAREQPPSVGLFLRLVTLASATVEQALRARLDLPRLRAELTVAVKAARAAGVADDRFGALPLAAGWVDDDTARALWADAFAATARNRPCWPGWRADPPAQVLARVAGAEVLAAIAAIERRLDAAT